MSNHFCIFLNEGNNSLIYSPRSNDKVYPLKQGHLLIINDTPYSVFSQYDETWHIIGHIDNLHLLNYLLFSHYPSNNEVIDTEIVWRAIKRYGLSIIELLMGNFCVVYEDGEGNLTLVTEDNGQGIKAGLADSRAAIRPRVPRWAASPRGPVGYSAHDAAARQAAVISLGDGGPPCPARKLYCHQPACAYCAGRQVSLVCWREERLCFIRSFRSPP
ncbi:carbapenam-3-carboxylate synthase domain-containing protein [Martelella alba]|uniref:DUF1933 domain-containing protein n=1 Tax=Martelella alba TaxID=2590451 RepID=A0ABY2SIW2_9HYPH|nr:carbapenam-3-carboxylate synthase domain-containing protein [Martelella alba]TKI04861.1 DUF1933 domain-containing protein [Martelella alba]